MINKEIGYLRVSTEDQCPDRQIDVMESICDQLFIETFSAETRNRPVFPTGSRDAQAGRHAGGDVD